MSRLVDEMAAGGGEPLGLLGLLRVVRDRFVWAIGAAFVCGVLAAVYVMTIAPRWEAIGLVELGEVGNVRPEESPLIESPRSSVERMLAGSSKDRVLTELSVSAGRGDSNADLFRDSFSVRLLPDTRVLEVIARGFSPEQARQFVEKSIELLASAHSAIAQPRIESLRAQREAASGEVKALERELSALGEAQQTGEASDGFSQRVLRASVIDAASRRLRESQRRQLELDELLGPSRTYPTRNFVPVRVSDRHVYPRRIRPIVLAAALGFVFTLLAGLVTHPALGFIGDLGRRN